MEKTLSFSIFKEKIIKTNELLSVLLEKNKSLDKSQKWIQHLKTKLELSKNEAKKLKLRNETLTCNLTAVEKDHVLLQGEHKRIKELFSRLENEANNTINSLQVNYQLANQELEECKKRLSMLDETGDEVESSSVRNLRSPSKRKQSLTKRRRSPQGENIQHDVTSMSKEVCELIAEKEKLSIEKADFQLEIYELKQKISNLQSVLQIGEDIDPLKMKQELVESKKNIEEKDKDLEKLSKQMKKLEKQKEILQADNERLKIENSLCQEEMSTLQKNYRQNEQLELIELKKKHSTAIKTKNNEINKLSNELKIFESKRAGLQEENEKLKRENCSLQLEISVLQQNCRENRTELCMLEGQSHNSPLESGDSHIINEDQIGHEIMKPINACSNENNTTPTDEEVCAIMKQMIVPDKLSPLNEDAPHNERSLSPFEDNTDKSPTPPPNLRPNNQESSFSNSELLKKNVIKRRNYLKKRRQFARKKLKQVNLLGALLALKKANINFIISGNSFGPSDHYSSSRLINLHRYKNTKPKHFEKEKANTITKELNCSLICCKNTYMVLKGDNDDEDAPLLGFFGVKNESSGCQKCTIMENLEYNYVVPKSLQTQCSVTKLKTTINKRIIEKNSVYDDIRSSNEPVEQLINSVDEDTCDKSKKKNNEVNNRKESSQSQNKRMMYSNCSNNEPLERICYTSAKDNYNQADENTQTPMNVKRKPPDRPEVRRSKRKCNSLVAMLKKRRTQTKNALAITKCTVSHLEVHQNEETLASSVQNQLKSSSNENSRNTENAPIDDFVFKKPIAIPKSPRTTFKRPVCNKNSSVRLSITNETCDKNDGKENLQEGNREDVSSRLETPTSPTPVKSAAKPKSPKTTFKRPICSTRRSQRLSMVNEDCDNSDYNENVQEGSQEESVPLESPKSPTPENQPAPSGKPVLIPLEKAPETVDRMPTSKIEMLFNKLILYSAEEEALNEVVREFLSQEPQYIAQVILERIALDYHDSADTKYSPAPLMTDVQRTMLGFMSKLEKAHVIGVFESYLTLAEQRLLTCNKLQEFGPVTRLYLAVCKLHKNITKMRKLCCDVFYFCGDLAIPFLFTVLTSWTEVLPHAADAKDFPLARVLVQVVYTTDCNKPGYNHMPLRDLLIKFYGYPTERWDYNEFFKELFDGYLKNPSRSSDFALLLYCKSRPEQWVYEKVEEYLKPLVNMEIQDNFKATLVILIGNLYNRFSSKSEVNYLPKIREWLLGLVNEKTPDVVKRCVYVSLNRLKKK